MTPRITPALLALMFLVGCATTGNDCKPPPPSADKAAELVIYRPANAPFGSNYDFPISIDDCIVGWLEHAKYIRYKVSAGAPKVRAEKRALAMGGDAEIRAGVSAGETAYIRLVFVTLSAAVFTVTNKQVAEKELPALAAPPQ